MTRIKKGSSQYRQNLDRQKFLKDNGVNIKLDGSWGPWQQKWYDKIVNQNRQNWFTKATIGAAMIENPTVMTASGWKQDKSGNWIQKPTKETDQLADNLAKISEVTWTAPTLIGDVGILYNIVRHPIQSARTTYNIGKDLLWFARNPRSVKVYHGSNTDFPLSQSRTASASNIGIHVSPKKEISESFSREGFIKEAYIPRHNAETIDIGYNNRNLLSNNYIFESRQFPNSYDSSGNNQLMFNLLDKYGANPEYGKSIANSPIIFTKNRVSVPLRSETFKLSKEAQEKADQIVNAHSAIREEEVYLNQMASDLLSNNGYKVIKYNNVNPYEGGGGTSYIITDPKVFYIPKSTFNQKLTSINLTKYPIIYGVEENKRFSFWKNKLL